MGGEIPARVGRFEVTGLVGRGGMATVYAARDPELGRPVAVKVLAAQLAGDPIFRHRFLRESEQAAALDHPNIVPIYERGESGGLLYVAMRYVEGGDLGQLLRREGALAPERALWLLRQAAAALDHAHRHGAVHRDVKPQNILISQSEGGEHVYLADFGITKQLQEAATRGLTLTGPGQVVGTVEYMSPEQFSGGVVDTRTDVYALSCVLYECLTGRVPFRAETPAQVMYGHLSGERPRASLARAGLPAGLDEVLAWGLAADPGGRPGSCGELVGAVEAALSGRPVSVPVAPVSAGLQPAVPPAAVGPIPAGGPRTVSTMAGPGLFASAVAPPVPTAVPPAPGGQRPDWLWALAVWAPLVALLLIGVVLAVLTPDITLTFGPTLSPIIAVSVFGVVYAAMLTERSQTASVLTLVGSLVILAGTVSDLIFNALFWPRYFSLQDAFAAVIGVETGLENLIQAAGTALIVVAVFVRRPAHGRPRSAVSVGNPPLAARPSAAVGAVPGGEPRTVSTMAGPGLLASAPEPAVPVAVPAVPGGRRPDWVWALAAATPLGALLLVGIVVAVLTHITLIDGATLSPIIAVSVFGVVYAAALTQRSQTASVLTLVGSLVVLAGTVSGLIFDGFIFPRFEASPSQTAVSAIGASENLIQAAGIALTMVAVFIDRRPAYGGPGSYPTVQP